MEDSLDKSAPPVLYLDDDIRFTRWNLPEAMRTPQGRARAVTAEETGLTHNPNEADMFNYDTRLEDIRNRPEPDKDETPKEDYSTPGITPKNRAANQYEVARWKNGDSRISSANDIGRDRLRKSIQTPIVELIEERRRWK